jgi:hypothetical protein
MRFDSGSQYCALLLRACSNAQDIEVWTKAHRRVWWLRDRRAWTHTPIDNAGTFRVWGHYLSGLVDKTESQEANISKSAMQLGHTDVVIERLRSCKDVPSVVNCLLERSLELVNTTLGNIQLMDSKTGTLEIAAQRGFHPDFLNFFRQVKTQDGCACGRVVRYREPTIIQDVMLDEEFAPYRKIALRAGFRAVQSTPIISSSGAFVGVVSTHFPTSHRPSNDQMALIKTIAQHAADQIVRHRSPRTRSNANRFLAALPQADYALLAPHLRTISLDRGTILHDAGEPIAHVYFPHSGMISIVATMRDGATVEIASLGAPASSARMPRSARISRLAGRWSNCRAPQAKLQPSGYKPPSRRARQSVSLPCATTICCWSRSNSRSPAMRCTGWNSDSAGGSCNHTTAATAMPYP